MTKLNNLMMTDKKYLNDEVGFEHLHLHTDFSLLDGFGMVEEYAERATKINQKYLCVTDHGMMGAIPRQLRACSKFGIKPQIGIEFYLSPNHPSNIEDFEAMTTEERKKIKKSYHLLAIAYNNQGYSNLVQLSSWAYINGQYIKPRINYEQLNKYKEGIFFTSCCYNSEIGQAFDQGGEEAGFAMVEKYMEMFGENFFLEIMLLDFVKQKPYDEFIIKAHSKYHIPIILTQDCLVDGTLVWTNKGFRHIEDILPEDQVLTHKARYREVEIVASRKVRPDEKVYEVKASVGSYSFRATGNHKIYVFREGEYHWIPTESLEKTDKLVYPDYSECGIYSENGLKSLNLLNYFSSDDFYEEEYVDGKNFGCGLRLEDDYFVSRRGFAKGNEVRIPIYLPVDDDFLKVLGWYIAEGWSDANSHQVGFALHADEQDVADFLLRYFSEFGIKGKIYKVSEKGIAVRFSSKVFNRVLGEICGKGANNKHLPYIDGTWIGKFSDNQMRIILKCIHLGDGSDNKSVLAFHSTSRVLIYEIATAMNGFGFLAIPSFDRKRKKPQWKPCWHLNFSGKVAETVRRYLSEEDSESCVTRYWEKRDGHWLIKISEVVPVEYEGNVHDLQVAEDHSFTANMAVVSNCHYCNKEDSEYQRYMLMIYKKSSIKEIEKKLSEEEKKEIFELQDTNLWMKSERELNEKWLEMYSDVIPYDIFAQAKRNTVSICQRAKVEIDRSLKLPKIPDAEEKFKEALFEGFKERNLIGQKKYMYRLKEEYELICRKGFASYFLIQKQFTDEARRICPQILGWGTGHEAVGPGRGCLHPETVILTENKKPIKDVIVGDVVFTRKGKKRVIDKLKYQVKEKLIKLNNTILTLDHKIFSGKEWKEARYFNIGDTVCGLNHDVLIREREIIDYEGFVYDLTVEDEHEYFTEDFLVHNSAVGSLSCYVMGITDVDPVKNNLLFSRFLSENRGGKSIKLRFSKK